MKWSCNTVNTKMFSVVFKDLKRGRVILDWDLEKTLKKAHQKMQKLLPFPQPAKGLLSEHDPGMNSCEISDSLWANSKTPRQKSCNLSFFKSKDLFSDYVFIPLPGVAIRVVLLPIIHGNLLLLSLIHLYGKTCFAACSLPLWLHTSLTWLPLNLRAFECKLPDALSKVGHCMRL